MSAPYKFAGIVLLVLVAGVVLTVPNQWFNGDRSIDDAVLTSDDGATATAIAPQSRSPKVGRSVSQQGAVTADGSKNAPSSLSIVVEDGWISVSLENTRLGGVLDQISGDVRIAIMPGDGVGQQRVSVSFSDLPIDQGLRRILMGQDAFYYHRGRHSSAGDLG